MTNLNVLGKKAEISSGMIIGVLILVLGAVLIILVYATIDWKGITNTEVCHASIIFRGAIPKLGQAAGLIPLNCETQKICITAGLFGGKCTGEKGFSEEDKVLNVKVKNLEEIEKFISRDLLDCWNMMGQGKLSLYSDFLQDNAGVGFKSPHCFVCSRIAFNKEKLIEKGIDLSDLNVLEYMETHQAPESNVSYYEYMGGKIGAIPDFEIIEIQKDDPSHVFKITEEDLKQLELVDVNEEDEQMAIMFSQIFAPTKTEIAKNDLVGAGVLSVGAIAAAGSFLGPLGGAKAAGGLFKLFLNPYVLAVGLAAFGAQMANVNYNRYLTAGYCGPVTSGESARQGCSIIQITPYTAGDLSARCGYFEGKS